MTNILQQSLELRKIWSGFRQARVLITANDYRVFDYLIKPQTAKTVSKKLNVDLRAIEILLDALTGLGLLKKKMACIQPPLFQINFWLAAALIIKAIF